MENRALGQSLRNAATAYIRTSRVVVKIFLGIFAVWAVVGIVGCANSSKPEQTPENYLVAISAKPEDTHQIEVTAINVKHPDKYRYFFSIKNKATSSFFGSIEITLVNKEAKRVTLQNFDTNDSGKWGILPEISKIVYLDARTAPASIHGDAGVYTYRFVAKNNDGKIVYSDIGKIPQEVTE